MSLRRGAAGPRGRCPAESSLGPDESETLQHQVGDGHEHFLLRVRHLQSWTNMGYPNIVISPCN
jgi:hypothetical protein